MILPRQGDSAGVGDVDQNKKAKQLKDKKVSVKDGCVIHEKTNESAPKPRLQSKALLRQAVGLIAAFLSQLRISLDLKCQEIQLEE